MNLLESQSGVGLLTAMIYGKDVDDDAIITKVPELQDVQGPKRVAPPPTAQTHEPKWTIF